MDLPNPTEEQIDIINNLKHHNVIVQASAGSGKTSTSFLIAKHNPDLKILLLTYSSKLKDDSRIKAQEFGVENIEIHSFHAFAVKYYNRSAFNDIKKALNSKAKTFSYDIIIIDESQDMDFNLYKFVKNIIRDNTNEAKLCVLGDSCQTIFHFKKSDHRFITLSDKIYPSKLKWSKNKLTESFRVPKEICTFINKSMMKYQKIVSKKSTKKPRYLICNLYKDSYDEVEYYLNLCYKPEDIFIIAPSVKSESSPARALANLLTENSIPIMVSNSDEDAINPDEILNKIAIITIHQSKGLERKVVIFLGFDSSYFEFYKKDHDVSICPNELYVACTRAKERLSVLHGYNKGYLEFLELRNCCEFLCIRNIKETKNFTINKTYTVSKLTQYLCDDYIEEALNFIKLETLKISSNKISVKNTVGDYLSENVSTITGIAIPAYFEHIKHGKLTIYDECIRYRRGLQQTLGSKETIEIDFDSLDSKFNGKYSEVFDGLENVREHLLYISTVYSAYRDGFKYRLMQLESFDWLSEEKLNKLSGRLSELFEERNEMDEKFEERFKFKNKSGVLVGVVDCITPNTVYEFKCVESLNNEHILQLALYKLLVEKKESRTREYLLYNVLDNNLIKIEGDNLEELFNYLVRVKNEKTEIDDEEFIDSCLES